MSSISEADRQRGEAACSAWLRLLDGPEQALGELRVNLTLNNLSGELAFARPADKMSQVADDAPAPVASAIADSASATRLLGLAYDNLAYSDEPSLSTIEPEITAYETARRIARAACDDLG